MAKILKESTVEIYATPGCPKCEMTKNLLNVRGIGYEYKMIGVDYEKNDLEERLGRPIAEAPQIFSDGEYIGNFEAFKTAVMS